MGNQNLDQLVREVSQMSEDDKRVLRNVLDQQLADPANGIEAQDVLKAGWAKHLVVNIADDFDQPLEDFKEYME